MQCTRKPLDRGARLTTVSTRPRMSWSALLGLAALLAGCVGGAPSSGAGSGTGGPTTSTSGGPPGEPCTEPPSDKAPTCSVTSDTALCTADATSPAIAFGAGHFAATWIEEDGSLHVTVVDDRGQPTSTHVVPTGPRAAQPAVTALPGGGFLVVWQDSLGVRGARIGADASPTCSAFSVAPCSGGDPRPTTAAAAAGTVIAWGDARGVNVGDLKRDALGGRTTVAGAFDPALAASKDEIGLVFVAGCKVGFARVSLPLGAVDPVLFREAPGKANVPRISPAGKGSFYVAWEDDRNGSGNELVYLTRVGADGKAANEVAVPGDGGSANYPDVATVAGHAAVVYYQFRDGPPAIYLSLLGPDLRHAGEDLRISTKGARFPRIAAGNGGTLGVVYARNGGAARLALLACH